MSILVTNISSFVFFFSVVGKIVKSRAEIQKPYRQRLKEKNNNNYIYLRKENEDEEHM